MQSEKLEEISQALAKVQLALRPSEKSGTNPAFGARKYSTLGDVWDAIRSPLSDNDLSIAQGVDQGLPGADSILWTLLMHKSGQFIRSEMPMLLTKKDPQGVGAAMTYYRRYSLAAMVGVTQEDDDGNSAMPGRQAETRTQRPPAQQRPPAAPAPQQRPPATPAPAPVARPAQPPVNPEDQLFTKHQAAIERAGTLAVLQTAVNDAHASGLPAPKIEMLKALASVRKANLTPAPAGAGSV